MLEKVRKLVQSLVQEKLRNSTRSHRQSKGIKVNVSREISNFTTILHHERTYVVYKEKPRRQRQLATTSQLFAKTRTRVQHRDSA